MTYFALGSILALLALAGLVWLLVAELRWIYR